MSLCQCTLIAEMTSINRKVCYCLPVMASYNTVSSEFKAETHRPSITITMSPSSICSLFTSSNLLVAFISFGWTWNTNTRFITIKYKLLQLFAPKTQYGFVSPSTELLQMKLCYDTSFVSIITIFDKKKTMKSKIVFKCQMF